MNWNQEAEEIMRDRFGGDNEMALATCRGSVDPAARVDVLTSNKVDITLANFTVTDERKEKVDHIPRFIRSTISISGVIVPPCG